MDYNSYTGRPDFLANLSGNEVNSTEKRNLSDMFPHGIPAPMRVTSSFSPFYSRTFKAADQLELHRGDIILAEQLNDELRWCFGRSLDEPSLQPGWFPLANCESLEIVTVPSSAPTGVHESISSPPSAGIGVAFAFAGFHRLLVAILQPGPV
jgi:hypothetical protein